MKKVVCTNGHFYDADRFASCPICGQSCDEAELKSGNPGNPAFESEETVPLPPSFAVDELASTTWISPDEMRALWGDDAPEEAPPQEPFDQSKPVEAPSQESQESYKQQEPSEEPRKIAPPSQLVDELAPTMWIAPDLENLSERAESGEKALENGGAPLPEEDAAVAGEAAAPEAEETDSCTGEISNTGESPEVQEVCDEPPAAADEPDTQPHMTLAQAVAASDAVGISPVPQAVQEMAAQSIPDFLPVGWLVGLSGSGRGKIFPCKSGRNRIGRELQMDIALLEESSVDPVGHAQIIFEPKKRQFFIQAGSGNGLSYLNHELVFTHEELHAYDRITLGEAEFLFLPLCGERFDWDANTYEE